MFLQHSLGSRYGRRKSSVKKGEVVERKEGEEMKEEENKEEEMKEEENKEEEMKEEENKEEEMPEILWSAMPVPPPPPPPAPPPPPPPCTAHPPQSRPDPPSLQSVGGRGGRNALLVDIQKGARLKKVLQVHDRSAPVVDKPRASGGLSQDHPQGGSGEGAEAMRPSLGGLFSGGFPILRPAGQRAFTGKNVVSRSSSSTGLKPQWNPPPTSSDSGHTPEPYHRPTERGSPSHHPAHSASAPPSPSHSKPPLSITAPTTTLPPPPPSFHERPSSRPPPSLLVLPLLPLPKSPSLPGSPSSTLTPYPSPLPSSLHAPSSLPNRNSGFFYPPPPSPILSSSLPLLPPLSSHPSPSSLPRRLLPPPSPSPPILSSSLPPPPSPVLSPSSELRFSISGPHGPLLLLLLLLHPSPPHSPPAAPPLCPLHHPRCPLCRPLPCGPRCPPPTPALHLVGDHQLCPGVQVWGGRWLLPLSHRPAPRPPS
uniref:WAS/WASL-interacting protein family member 3-like isoform X2 n=1 Tax=Oncorhynchus gorbuscha TaxID=8017 RepID=UPI001EAEF224|nr:WAS/WASL-interacting protein family member 3-like isoform X2 [Oncorhynchus gorbuscha]